MAKNRTTRFLVVSFSLVVALCIIIFSFLSVFMNRKSSQTISEIGTIYMTGLSERISLHFETMVDLRLKQVEALAEDISSGGRNSQELREELAYSAKVREFDYLAFYSAEGEFDMIYGDTVKVTDPDPFLHSLRNGEKKVAVGTNSSGDEIILMGVPGDYAKIEMEEYVALVAGVPSEYIKEVLSLDSDDILTYSHVIRNDGSYVIRSQMFGSNYFDQYGETVDLLGGGSGKSYIEGLQEAISEERDYSSVVEVNGEQRHVYCKKLPSSEWFLITVLPYGSLDTSVNHLSDVWSVTAFASCMIILLALMLIFIKYLSLTKNQLTALEEARVEAVNANKAKSEFLSNMSHDIRTPMNAIVGMTAIATANIDDKQRVQNCLRKITLSSKHLLGLINDILDMSKIESGKMTLGVDKVSLREVVESIVSIVQPQIHEKNQKFDVSLGEIFAESVYCDGLRLNQILLNFLSNAIKFTPEGGAIRLSVEEEYSLKGDDYVRVHFRVKDSGIGMSKEFKEKIFESFAREDNTRVRKIQGSGLGMAIAKYIVDTMGGEIEVESELGKGSLFHVALDLEKAPEKEENMVLPDWNMLLVDDDEQLCQSTMESLKDIGVKADWTLDGETAIRMAQEHHEHHTDYHIILLDWRLPGISGIETARRIRKSMGDDVPILLISAYDWSEIEEEARSAGINGFISKPLFKSTLFYGLRQYAGIEKEHQEAEEETKKESDIGGRHILLAEDNDLNWEIAEELLGGLGVILERAENGRICVEKFTQAPVGFYDAILMDIRMPEMTGYEASDAIRALEREDADIPIIAMTADAFGEDIQRCLDHGMNCHVAKPIDMRELVHVLEKFMR